MGRHGYSDEYDEADVAMWRGVIASASRGKRGQTFFRALVAALDAMPEKRLIQGELEDADGSVCALGALGKARGVPIGSMDPDENWEALGELFNIAHQLAQETMYINDECGGGSPEERWRRVRAWAARQIRIEASELEGTDGQEDGG